MEDDELKERSVNILVHNELHLPIRGFAYENGVETLTREVHRRQKNCPKCDELYEGLPVPTNLKEITP